MAFKTCSFLRFILLTAINHEKFKHYSATTPLLNKNSLPNSLFLSFFSFHFHSTALCNFTFMHFAFILSLTLSTYFVKIRDVFCMCVADKGKMKNSFNEWKGKCACNVVCTMCLMLSDHKTKARIFFTFLYSRDGHTKCVFVCVCASITELKICQKFPKTLCICLDCCVSNKHIYTLCTA